MYVFDSPYSIHEHILLVGTLNNNYELCENV